jgi:hypothetical protein
MSQMSFGDAEYAGKRKQTRREVFLAEMDQVARNRGQTVPYSSLFLLYSSYSSIPLYSSAIRGLVASGWSGARLKWHLARHDICTQFSF